MFTSGSTRHAAKRSSSGATRCGSASTGRSSHAAWDPTQIGWFAGPPPSSALDTSRGRIWPTIVAGGTLCCAGGTRSLAQSAGRRPGDHRDRRDGILSGMLDSGRLRNRVEFVDPGRRAGRRGRRRPLRSSTATGVRLSKTYGRQRQRSSHRDTLRRRTTAGRPPIGRPIGGVRAYLFDRDGVRAEGGRSSNCVWRAPGWPTANGRPGFSCAERFGPRPSGGGPTGWIERGDRGPLAGGRAAAGVPRWLDRQLKVRGVRIEPGEVEGRRTEHSAVGQPWSPGRPGPGELS